MMAFNQASPLSIRKIFYFFISYRFLVIGSWFLEFGSNWNLDSWFFLLVSKVYSNTFSVILLVFLFFRITFLAP